MKVKCDWEMGQLIKVFKDKLKRIISLRIHGIDYESKPIIIKFAVGELAIRLYNRELNIDIHKMYIDGPQHLRGLQLQINQIFQYLNRLEGIRPMPVTLISDTLSQLKIQELISIAKLYFKGSKCRIKEEEDQVLIHTSLSVIKFRFDDTGALNIAIVEYLTGNLDHNVEADRRLKGLVDLLIDKYEFKVAKEEE